MEWPVSSLVFCCAQKPDSTESHQTYQDKPLPIQSSLSLHVALLKDARNLHSPSHCPGTETDGVFTQ